MTIELLDKGTILVSLCARDMEAYSLSFEKETTKCPETGLKRLLYHVGETCGLDHSGKSYLIEALPSCSGCLLIISVRKAKYRKKYRIKRERTAQLYVFFDADAMLDYRALHPEEEGYSVYRYRDRFVLIPWSGIPADIIEYAENCPLSETAIAHVTEYGALLWQKELQRRHIGGRTVTVRNAALRHGGG